MQRSGGQAAFLNQEPVVDGILPVVLVLGRRLFGRRAIAYTSATNLLREHADASRAGARLETIKPSGSQPLAFFPDVTLQPSEGGSD
jgi:hypothetical protein